MLKSVFMGLLSMCCIMWSVTASGQDDKTYTGEVLDLSCYIKSGAKGADHAQCAKSCVKSGQPMGLLTKEGDVLLLAAGSDKEKIEVLKDLAGEMVEVQGKESERDGITMVVVSDAKKSDP
jgi:hypothetical protein